MKRSPLMGSTLPKNEPATQRQLGFGAIANTDVDEEGRKAAEREKVHELTTAFYAVFKHALGESGGPEALRSRLDETDSFKSEVSKGVNRVKDGTGQRGVRLEWAAGVAVDADGAYALLAGLSEVLGFEPPARQRVLTREQTADTTLDVVSELPETVKSGIRAAVAKRRGVRPGDVKL